MTDMQRAQLFCLPHAGGTSSIYESWRRLLSPEVELIPIEIPGRGRRSRERSLCNMEDLTEDIIAEILLRLDPPFSLFGHSMGAVLAFECVRTLSIRHGFDPFILFVSGHRAPQLPSRSGRAMHQLDDVSFLACARELAGDLNDALEYKELREPFLPVLRADLMATETYVFRPGKPLTCDIVALGGIDDPYVSKAELAAWAEQTEAGFDMRLFAGNHFFVHHTSDHVITEIAQRLLAKHRLERRAG